MAATKGTDTKIAISTTDIGFSDNYTFSTNMGSAEITSFGDAWQANIATIRDVSISFSGTYDKSDAGQDLVITEILTGDGNIADLRAYVGVSNYFTGSAVLSNFTISSAVADKVSYSATAVGNGVFTFV